MAPLGDFCSSNLPLLSMMLIRVCAKSYKIYKEIIRLYLSNNAVIIRIDELRHDLG